MPMKDKIEIYAALSSQEREEVDAFVSRHPEYAADLTEAKQIAELLKLVRESGVTEDDIAHLAARRALEPHNSIECSRVTRAIQSDRDLAELYELYSRRLQELDEDHDAVSHFEVLTGITIDVKNDPSPDARMVREPARSQLKLLSRREFWPAIAAVMAFLALVGVLGLAQWNATSDLERAGFAASQEMAPDRFTITPRSTDQYRLTPTDSLFLQGLQRLQNARIPLLGIIPRVDAGVAHEAEAIFTDVLGRLDETEFLALEVRFARATAFLMQERADEALRDLEFVVKHEGLRHHEALALAAKIRRSEG
jgi:hypothetical protein